MPVLHLTQDIEISNLVPKHLHQANMSDIPTLLFIVLQFPMGPGPDGPMGGMGAMEQHHMNGSLGEY